MTRRPPRSRHRRAAARAAVVAVVWLLAACVPPALAAEGLRFTPALLDVTLAPGTTATRPVTLESSSPDARAELRTDRSWLTVPPGPVALPATVAVTVDAGTLEPGVHVGTVTATTPGQPPAALGVTVVVTGPVAVKVNFQSAGAPVPAGHRRDHGEAFGPRTGPDQGPAGSLYGWVEPGTTEPRDLVGNGRDRNRPGIDQRYDTLVHAQGDDVPRFAGVALPGAWELAVPNGTYDVLVAVGDQPSGGIYDSVHHVAVEGTVAIDRFRPSPAQEHRAATVTVTVHDGRLTLDPTGGTNTKFCFVHVTTHADAPADTTPPAPPTAVAAAGGDGTVHLSWHAPLDPDLAGYRVHRATTPAVTTTGPPLSGDDLVTGTSFADSTVTNGTPYWYVVQAVDAHGNASSAEPVSAVPAPPAATTLQVNFQDPATAPPPGYVRDSGEPYGGRTGRDQGRGLAYGWVVPGRGTPLDLTANGRNRNRPPTNAAVADLRLATLLAMQYTGPAGNPAPGAWEVAVPNGSYRVTVSVGDPSYVDSVHSIVVEGTPVITGFRPTPTQLYVSSTATVEVADGRLTVTAAGGRNTKIQYLDLAPDTGDAPRPSVRSTTPADGATGVRRDTAVVAEVALPNVGAGVDAASLTPETVQLVRADDGAAVPANRNTSGGGDVIVVQPTVPLDPDTTYRFTVTSGVKDVSGAPFVPNTATFTTGREGAAPAGSVAFTKVNLPEATGRMYTSVVMGPDGRLYAGTLDGIIVRFPVGDDGTLGRGEAFDSLRAANGGNRTITGLAFDPAAPATDPVVWVAHNHYAFTNAPDWTGKISRLSGASLEDVRDYVVNLPRSLRDHETNSPVFGPDGALYVAQGAQSSGGAPDTTWGMRPETPLTAAVLRVDLRRITDPPLDVRTPDGGGTYDPTAPGAPVTVHASGVRNAFDLLWHSNGRLYAPTNGSAPGGNVPATPSPRPASCGRRIDAAEHGPWTGPATPGVRNMASAESDWVHVIEPGGYYGHPNPSRCEWVFNGGNPTAGADPHELAEYPVGVAPDRNWRGASSFAVGPHFSPNGVIEYRSPVFGADLQGRILVVRYSAGDDIQVLTPGPDGTITASQVGLPGLTGFDDPVDLVEGRDGHLYVAELGANRITLLRPGRATGGTPAAAVSPDRLVTNDPQGGSGAAPQTVTITNSGTGHLSVTDVAVTGPDAARFTLETPPTLPLTIAPGSSTRLSVRFTADAAGPQRAGLTLTTDDPARPTVTVALRGLGTTGIGGAGEPSLQWILDTYDIPVDVGDPDPATVELPRDPDGGDEVPLPRFVKAGGGPVTVRPLAVFAPDGDPVARLGWYRAGRPDTGTAVLSVAAGSAQTLTPRLSGPTSFDPGTGAFGLWTRWPSNGDRTVHQEGGLDTFEGAHGRHVKVFPMREGGAEVPNTYVVAVEAVDGDWNDLVLVVANVRPADGVTGPDVAVTSPDLLPGSDRLAFNRIGPIGNPLSVRERATVRVANRGTAPLALQAVTPTDPWRLAPGTTLPGTLAPAGHVDVPVLFTAAAGTLGEGTLVAGTLTVATDDPDTPALTIPLRGLWQPVSENAEPSLPDLVNGLFGWGTTIVHPGQRLNRAGLVTTVGDEVLAPSWARADPSRPVAVRQVAAFHTQHSSAAFRWTDGATGTTHALTSHRPDAAQSLLPVGPDGAPAAGTFAPTGAFTVDIDGESSDPRRNATGADVARGCPGPCGHHVRAFPVRDGRGAVVPDTWLIVMDYRGINFDYQDNVYLMANARPAPQENP